MESGSASSSSYKHCVRGNSHTIQSSVRLLFGIISPTDETGGSDSRLLDECDDGAREMEWKLN